MPPIKPTMREKKRYVLFALESEAPLNEETVKRGTYAALISFLGEYGASLASPKFIGYRASDNLGVLRCDHEEVEKVKAALALCRTIDGKKVAFRLKKVSGTILSLNSGFEKEKE